MDGKAILKEWTIYTSSPAVAKALGKRCSNTGGKSDHSHATIEGIETERSGHYSPQMAKAI
eukprot:2206503-Alexandrium_andersonii.AAC.1